jgi:hypothetical protein
VELADRRRVRNHLDSIHAVALMNLAELSTGLALNTALPDDARAILVRLTIEYVKKARGTLTSACDLAPVASSERREVEVAAEIRDAQGEVVARAAALWLVGRVAAGGRGGADGRGDRRGRSGQRKSPGPPWRSRGSKRRGARRRERRVSSAGPSSGRS